MRLRIFTEPQQGASYSTLRRVAKAAEDLGFDAFFRSDHYLRMGDGSGAPGPTDAWATLAALAVETSTIRLGTLVTAATFRLPGPLAITVAQVDEMSGGRVEFGLGTGWYDGEHRGLRNPVPAAEGAVRPLRRAAGDHHRPVVHPRRPDVLLRRRVLLAHGLARAAQAGSAAEGAGDHRRRRRAPHPGPRRALRRRVQRGVPHRRGHGRRVRPGAGRVRRGGPRPGVDDLLGRPRDRLRQGRGRARPPRRRDRPRPVRTALDRPGRAPRRRSSTRSAPTPRPAPPRSTCRSSTWPTSTTWTSSPPRSCPRSNRSPSAPDHLTQVTYPACRLRQTPDASVGYASDTTRRGRWRRRQGAVPVGGVADRCSSGRNLVIRAFWGD